MEKIGFANYCVVQTEVQVKEAKIGDTILSLHVHNSCTNIKHNMKDT
jgi:hypothetical protein